MKNSLKVIKVLCSGNVSLGSLLVSCCYFCFCFINLWNLFTIVFEKLLVLCISNAIVIYIALFISNLFMKVADIFCFFALIFNYCNLKLIA